jgi:hypothetical protein
MEKDEWIRVAVVLTATVIGSFLVTLQGARAQELVVAQVSADTPLLP